MQVDDLIDFIAETLRPVIASCKRLGIDFQTIVDRAEQLENKESTNEEDHLR